MVQRVVPTRKKISRWFRGSFQRENKISRWFGGSFQREKKFPDGSEGRSNEKIKFPDGSEGRSNEKIKFLDGSEGRSNEKKNFPMVRRVVPTRKKISRWLGGSFQREKKFLDGLNTGSFKSVIGRRPQGRPSSAIQFLRCHLPSTCSNLV